MEVREFVPLSPAPRWTYWVVPGRFLAGPYPGDTDEVEHVAKLDLLLDAGVESFLCLQEEEELKRFRPYADVVERLAIARGLRTQSQVMPIPDQSVPSIEHMDSIIATIDELLERTRLYLHCWGGVGRTGTVVCCWLLRHELATPETVFRKLEGLRQMDQQRGYRRSPENDLQDEFVRAWARRLG